MTYSSYHYDHIGNYECPNCGLKRQDTSYTVTSADLEKGEITINNKYKIELTLKSLYNVYNLLAAFTVASITGVDGNTIAKSLSNMFLKTSVL